MIRDKKGTINFQFMSFLTLIFLFLIGLFLIGFETVKFTKKNDGEVLNYFTQKNLKYEVCLKENSFFEEKCLNTDREYITTIIDDINIDFEYIFSARKKIPLSYSYEITAELVANEKIKSKKKIYDKKEVIASKNIEGQSASNYIVKERVTINYDKYNEVMQELKKEYAILFDSKLIVTLSVKTDSNVEGIAKKLSASESIVFEIPLSEQMINFKSRYNNQKTDYLLTNDEEFLKQKGESKKNLIYLVIIETVIIIALSILINIRLKRKNKFKFEISKIMKEYDRYITIVDSIPDLREKGQIVVSSFKELLDAREWLNKPIVYHESTKKGWFLIIDEKDVYSFIISK